MDWLVGVLLLVVGGIIGYFVAKYFNPGEKTANSEIENEQTVKQLMVQQATQHLHESKKIAEELNQQSTAMLQQISNYEQLLINQNSGGEESQLNYFGEHASTYLRNKGNTQNREKNTPEIQPLDFSSESSGLFSGTTEPEASKGK